MCKYGSIQPAYLEEVSLPKIHFKYALTQLFQSKATSIKKKKKKKNKRRKNRIKRKKKKKEERRRKVKKKRTLPAFIIAEGIWGLGRTFSSK